MDMEAEGAKAAVEGEVDPVVLEADPVVLEADVAAETETWLPPLLSALLLKCAGCRINFGPSTLPPKRARITGVAGHWFSAYLGGESH